MATVPRISEDRVRRSIAPGVRVSTRAPIEAFESSTAAIANATGELGQFAISIFKEEQKKADDALMFELSAILDQSKIDSDVARRKIQGKDAQALPEIESRNRTQTFQEASEKLNIPKRLEQRSSQLFTAHDLSGQREVNSYVFSEQKKYEEVAFQSAINKKNQAAMNSGDENEFLNSIMIGKSATRNHRTLQGVPKDEIDSQISLYESGMHTQWIDKLISAGDMEGAQRYFEEQKEFISSTELNESGLKKKIVKQQGQDKKNLAIVFNKNDSQVGLDVIAEKKTERELRELRLLGEIGDPGGISKTLADASIAYLKSTKTVNSVTNPVVYAEFQDRLLSLDIEEGTGKTTASLEEISNFRSDVIKEGGKGDLSVTDVKGYIDDVSPAIALKKEELTKSSSKKLFWNVIRSFTNPFALLEIVEETKDMAEAKRSAMNSYTKKLERLSDEELNEGLQKQIDLQNEVIREMHIDSHPQRKDYVPGKQYTEEGVTFIFNGFKNFDDMDIDVIEKSVENGSL